MAKRSGSGGRESGLEAEIGELYSLPLGEFIAARNALASRLKKAGGGADSERVRTLPKPTPSAWAVNRLLRTDRAAVDELLAAGDRARAAQGAAVSGRPTPKGSAGSAPEALRRALTDERERRAELVSRAAALLAETGQPPTATTLERLTANLDALALSPAADEARQRGYLTADLDPPGFEVLAGLQLATGARPRGALHLVPPLPEPASPRPVSRPGAAGPRAVEERAEDRRREKEREEEAALQARERQDRIDRIERLATQVERARVAERELREQAEAAERMAEEHERRAQEAERAATAARRQAERLRARQSEVGERLARARAELAAAEKES